MNDPADDAYEHVEAFNRLAITANRPTNSEEIWRKIEEAERLAALESKD